jgi:hypothetical protein
MRPEFAAWRYGEVMTGRARRALYQTGTVASGALTAAGMVAAGPLALAVGAPVFAWMLLRSIDGPAPPKYDANKALYALRNDAGDLLLPIHHFLSGARIRPDRALPGGWGLNLQTGAYVQVPAVAGPGKAVMRYDYQHLLTGAPAVRALGVMMADANTGGGSRRQVDDAVRLIQRAGTPERWFAEAEQQSRRRGWGYQNVWEMPPILRLALEMASHEESERRALEGELADLEAAWRDAEALAAISDALLVPPAVEQKLASMQSTSRSIAASPPPPIQSAPAPSSATQVTDPAPERTTPPKLSGLAAARAEYARLMAERRSAGKK